MKQIEHPPTLEGWQHAARQALESALGPDVVTFRDASAEQPSLFAAEALRADPNAQDPAADTMHARARVPRAFLDIAEHVSAHSHPDRWDLLYRVLWRLTHDEPQLLAQAFDPDVVQLELYRRSVLRDIHKIHAFVRFREVTEADATCWVAWYNPDHHSLALAAPHFIRRFASMRWSILTPRASAHYDGQALTFGPGSPQHDAPSVDALEEMWRTYYRSIFNPARLKVKAMRNEMPARFWRSLPESTLIDELIRGASSAVVRQQAQAQPAAETAPRYASLGALRQDLSSCRACAWCVRATQAVGGEGPAQAKLVLVGEQPGDSEDKEGRPFVGPAGKLLDSVLEQSGIARQDVYLTNAVKHFKFNERGKRRLHQRPSAGDVAACRPWLQSELNLIKPKVVVGLGLSAALSLLGKSVRLSDVRGQWWSTPWCSRVVITSHPSAILRAESRMKDAMVQQMIDDLRSAHSALSGVK